MRVNQQSGALTLGFGPLTPNPGGTRPTGRVRMRSRRASSGYILVQTLVVVTALVALMAIMAADQRASMQQTNAKLDQRRAEMAVDAAVARAEATLQATNTNLVTMNDTWATLGLNGATPTAGTAPAPAEYQLYASDSPDQSAPTFRMQVIDAGSLINLNAAAQASTGPLLQQTAALQGVQQQLLDVGLTQQQVDCLLDWEQVQTTARPDGAKDDFYNSLQQPYNTKLAPLSTVNEVLLIDNWTGQTLYQPSTNSTSTMPLPVDPQGNTLPLASMVTVDSGAPNTQADGTARVRITARNERQYGFTPPGRRGGPDRATSATSFSQLFALPGMNTNRASRILDAVTFSTGRLVAKVNLNTAPQAVLQTIPSMTTDLAASIVGQQSATFSTLGALANVQGVTMPILRQVSDQFAVGSDTWIVRVYGHCGTAGVAVEATIRVTNSRPQVVTWDRINTPTVPSWWDWQDSSTTVDAASTT